MAQQPQGKNIGDWMLAYFTRKGLPATLSLVYMGWGRQRAGEPAYPVNPDRDCPRLDLYIDEAQPEPWTSGQSTYAAHYTFWYKRRQQPAEDKEEPVNHHLLLVQDVETIQGLLMGKWQPEETTRHTGVKVYPIKFGFIKYHDDLRHEIDEPHHRLSVAEIPLAVEARIQ